MKLICVILIALFSFSLCFNLGDDRNHGRSSHSGSSSHSTSHSSRSGSHTSRSHSSGAVHGRRVAHVVHKATNLQEFCRGFIMSSTTSPLKASYKSACPTSWSKTRGQNQLLQPVHNLFQAYNSKNQVFYKMQHQTIKVTAIVRNHYYTNQRFLGKMCKVQKTFTQRVVDRPHPRIDISRNMLTGIPSVSPSNAAAVKRASSQRTKIFVAKMLATVDKEVTPKIQLLQDFSTKLFNLSIWKSGLTNLINSMKNKVRGHAHLNWIAILNSKNIFPRKNWKANATLIVNSLCHKWRKLENAIKTMKFCFDPTNRSTNKWRCLGKCMREFSDFLGK